MTTTNTTITPGVVTEVVTDVLMEMDVLNVISRANLEGMLTSTESLKQLDDDVWEEELSASLTSGFEKRRDGIRSHSS